LRTGELGAMRHRIDGKRFGVLRYGWILHTD
jgi:hypothetical protein